MPHAQSPIPNHTKVAPIVNKVIICSYLTPKNPKIPETEKIAVNFNSSLHREDFYKLLSRNRIS